MEVRSIEVPVHIKSARIKKITCEAELIVGKSGFKRVVEREFEVDIPIE